MNLSVHIVQCLCPERHCIIGFAYERDEDENCGPLAEAACDGLRELIRRAIDSRTLNPWCGICRAPQSSWTYEDARSIFRTLEEARADLARAQEANDRARAMLGEAARN